MISLVPLLCVVSGKVTVSGSEECRDVPGIVLAALSVRVVGVRDGRVLGDFSSLDVLPLRCAR